ncbi:MAG: protease inhibitor I42 family protein [Microthrixaceae bacterium]
MWWRRRSRTGRWRRVHLDHSVERPDEDRTADRSLYGIDLSGLELPGAEPYRDYETVEDDTGELEIALPSDWDDVDTTKADRDGVEIPGVWASTDLGALNTGYTVPGLQADLRTASSPTKLFELLNSDNSTAESCSGPETFEYDDGLYEGTAELWTDCGDEGAALLELVALRAGNQYVTLEVQMLTDADIDAAVRAIEGFTATAIEPGEQWAPGDESATYRVGETFNVVIPNNPSVGDSWRISPTYDSAVVEFLYEDYESDDPTGMTAGAGGTSFFTFRAEAPGSTVITAENCFGCATSDTDAITETASLEVRVER